MLNKPKFCYLCGIELDYINDKISPDHVPPKQFYTKTFRTKNNPLLFTIDVHDKCNKSYQKDEDYFYHSIGPLAFGSDTGSLILTDLKKRFSKHRGSKVLGEMVLEEFIKNPSNLTLPNNLIGKKYDTPRINRIIWKILRGLYYKHFHTCLPIQNRHYCKIYSPLYPPPQEYIIALFSNKVILYPEILIYGYQIFNINLVPDDIKNIIKDDHDKVCIWSMLFWQKVPIYCSFLE